MLFRFSLYGFLKNQRYFEPFLVLFFLERGLSFFHIGLLVAFREVTVNLLEIPSGAIADLFGRRRSMIFAFTAYAASFLVFAAAESLLLFYPAMFLFAVGESFRTGTHKAMIFAWLRAQGRTDERTRVYGYTRSWSKIGSAVSVVLATAIVFVADGYAWVFALAAVPALLNIVNFLGYPRELDGERTGESRGSVIRHIREALREAVRRPGLRRLVLESMGFEGIFHAAKDYLQPVLKTAAAAAAVWWSFTAGLSEARQSALMIGIVYVMLYLLSASASRNAHRLAGGVGGEDRAARILWIAAFGLYGILAAAAVPGYAPLLIAAFVGIHVLQNIWRPVLISRFDAHSDEKQGATVLSIESQAQRLSTMIAAPLLGLAVDAVTERGLGGPFWPIGALGALVALFFLIPRRARFEPDDVMKPRPSG